MHLSVSPVAGRKPVLGSTKLLVWRGEGCEFAQGVDRKFSGARSMTTTGLLRHIRTYKLYELIMRGPLIGSP